MVDPILPLPGLSPVRGKEIVAGVDGMIGLLVNSIPVRVDTNCWDGGPAWLSRLQEQQATLRRHEHVSLAEIAGLVERATQAAPLFDAYFVLANYPDAITAGHKIDGIALDELEFHTLPEYPLTLFASPAGRLMLRCSFDRQDYDEADAHRLLAEMRKTLDDLSRYDVKPLGRGAQTMRAATGNV